MGFQPLLKSCSLNLLCCINTTSEAARKLSTLTSIPLLLLGAAFHVKISYNIKRYVFAFRSGNNAKNLLKAEGTDES